VGGCGCLGVCGVCVGAWVGCVLGRVWGLGRVWCVLRRVSWGMGGVGACVGSCVGRVWGVGAAGERVYRSLRFIIRIPW